MTQDDSPPPSTRPLQRLSGPILIVALGLALYLPGLRWGLPSVVSWSQDTIAGVRTLGAVDGWPGDWKGRYPPLHYFVLRAAYEPLLAHWTTTGERVVDPDSGKSSLSPPHAPKIGQLTLVARVTTVVMATLAGLGLWAAARGLLRDDLAACVAAAAMMTGAGFTYFAHLGNVDVPSVCWFAWSVYFYVRLIESRGIADAALLGLFAALAVSTKDAVGGMYPGMALFLLIQEVRYRRRSADGWAWRSLVQPRWFVGLIAFALPFVIINGLFANPDAYFTRIGGWLDPAPDAHLAHELRHTDFISLAAATLHHAAGAVGWPMLIGLAIGVAWTLRHRPAIGAAMLLPVVGYYVIVIMRIEFVYERFLFVPMAMIYILFGAAVAKMVRNARRSPILCAVALAIVFLPSLGYAIAVDAAMITDSRYQAEAWFRSNVDVSSSIGALASGRAPFSPQYLPRVHEFGYATFPVIADVTSFDQPQPEFLMLASYDRTDFTDSGAACVSQLLAGHLGYKTVAVFEGKYLGTGSSWLSLAGFCAPTPGKISPTITVFRRDTPP